ncbi:hypothetical protein P9E76_18105 [Schinkia azotoformans]|uniref:hypothetical protein n=1 Tax=Schinkia azotoformans TaxID=1454 RepID=UPI0002D8FE91|nr:hypothetical protein [Schinkia azotoformans]MEC1639638.1 hypothetical protein [Schinkia azotoformans]MEC1946938.1 hypothetical protein [Schinkia azotoformans]
MLQFLLLEAGLGINVGDIIFQLMSFLILLGIPLALIFILSKARRKRNDRLNKIVMLILVSIVSFFLFAFFFRNGIILDHLGIEINVPFIFIM